MNISQKYKLSSAALREINDACETLEKLWENYDKLKSPPSFRDLVVGFRSEASDQLTHIKYELIKSLIETDLHYRESYKIAQSKTVYVDMLLLEDESVLKHFDWKHSVNEEQMLGRDRVPQGAPRHRGGSRFNDETRNIASVETSAFVVANSSGESREHTWPFLDQPIQAGDLGSLGSDYRILKKIGSGGMGAVFLAEDIKLLRQVAIKVLHAVNDGKATESQQRFLREAQAMAAIESDHVVTVFRVGDYNGVVYLVMPFLRGETLGSRMRREQTLSQQESLRIAKEIAIGLSHAHGLGQIHRDIKPENIWLEEPSSKVKILDFGLVRTEQDTLKTKAGTVFGTPRHMSPEQVKGETVDATSDLFSLGTVLYQMLSGRPVFEGNSLHASLLAVSNCKYQSLSDKELAIDPKLTTYVDELLSKDPKNRPPSASSVVATLESFVGSTGQIESNPAALVNTTPKTAHSTNGNSRSKIWVWVAFFGFLLLLSLLVLKFRTAEGTVFVELDGDVEIAQIEIDGNKVNFTRNGQHLKFSVDPGTHRLTIKTPIGDVLQTSLTDKKLEVYSGKENNAIRAWVDKTERKPKFEPVGNLSEQELQLNALKWILNQGGASASVKLDGGEKIKVESVDEIPRSVFWIEGVNMRGCKFVNKELRCLSEISLIGSLDFWDSSLTDEGLATITKNGQKPLLKLSSFTAYRCDVSDKGFAYLKDSPLSSVVVPSTNIKTTAVLQNKRISRFHANVNLVRAVKEQCPEVLVGSLVLHESLPAYDLSFITPEMASWFPTQVKGERAFEYRRNVLPEENLKTWKNLKKVSPAGITFSFLSDEAGKLATDLEDLKVESVKWMIFNNGTSFSGKITELLLHVPNLKGLNFHGTHLESDAFDGIEKIRDQIQLTTINLAVVSGQFNRAAAQELANTLPECKILWRQEHITPQVPQLNED